MILADTSTVQIVRPETRVPHAADLIDAADALGTTATLPVVRIGHVGFDDLVAALWAHPPEPAKNPGYCLTPATVYSLPISWMPCAAGHERAGTV